jgi:uncharacterized membrane protein YidH (DUF202 family)
MLYLACSIDRIIICEGWERFCEERLDCRPAGHRIAGVNIEALGKILIGGALLLLVVGGLLFLLGRFGVDRLPGDLVFQRGNFTFYFPIGLMILVSIVLTIVLNVIFRR